MTKEFLQQSRKNTKKIYSVLWVSSRLKLTKKCYFCADKNGDTIVLFFKITCTI